MGDLSAEPSMEEILSSIKRIIAEEGDGTNARPRRQSRGPAPLQPRALNGDDGMDEVLELSDPMPQPQPQPHAQPQPEPRPEPAPLRAARPAPVSAPALNAAPEPIVSPDAAAASRGALDQLSRMMVKPEPGSDGSLEGLVRELLRPMLRDWLDANLPALVDTMVQREIKRITGQGG